MSAPGAVGTPGGPPPDGPGAGFRPSEPLRSFVRTVREVLLSPAEFFRSVSPSGPVGGAVLFALIASALSVPFLFLAAPLDPFVADDAWTGTVEWWRGVLEGTGAGALVALALVVLLLFPVFALLGIYVGAAVQHLFVWFFVRPENAGFGATLKATCYATAASLLSWVPVLGYALSLYALYLTFVGLRQLHGTSNARALLAMLPAIAFSLWGPLGALLGMFPGGG